MRLSLLSFNSSSWLHLLMELTELLKLKKLRRQALIKKILACQLLNILPMRSIKTSSMRREETPHKMRNLNRRETR